MSSSQAPKDKSFGDFLTKKTLDLHIGRKETRMRDIQRACLNASSKGERFVLLKLPYTDSEIVCTLRSLGVKTRHAVTGKFKEPVKAYW